jgi:hypothetical protein
MRSVQHRFQEFWMGFRLRLTCVFREGKFEYYICDLNFHCSIIYINRLTVCEFYDRSCHCASRAVPQVKQRRMRTFYMKNLRSCSDMPVWRYVLDLTCSGTRAQQSRLVRC